MRCIVESDGVVGRRVRVSKAIDQCNIQFPFPSASYNKRRQTNRHDILLYIHTYIGYIPTKTNIPAMCSISRDRRERMKEREREREKSQTQRDS